MVWADGNEPGWDERSRLEMNDELIELPEGWTYTNLSALSSQDRNAIKRGPFGSAIKKEFFVASGYKVYEQKNAIYNDCTLGNYYIDQEKFSELQDFQVIGGDIIVSCSGTVGKVSVLPETAEHGIINQALLKISLDERVILTDYFVKLFGSDFFQEIFLGNTRGSAMQNIASVKSLKQADIPLPPIAEQKRIVAKIEELRDRSQTARQALAAIPMLCDRFRQSVLAAAFRGELTADWREENPDVEPNVYFFQEVVKKRNENYKIACLEAKKNKSPAPKKPSYLDDYSYSDSSRNTEDLPSTWISVPVGMLCDCIVPGRDKPKSFTGSIPWITIPDITSDYIDKSSNDIGLSTSEIAEVNARVIPKDSVVMSCVGRFGIAAVVSQPVVVNQQLHAFLSSELILPEYLMFHIRTLTDYMEQVATATTVAYINKANCNNLPINLAPLQEQEVIVSCIKNYFKSIDRIQQQYEIAKTRLDQLDRAILAQAFRGELVPQDPTDEPAAVLLDRIRQARQQISDNKTKKAKSRKSS